MVTTSIKTATNCRRPDVLPHLFSPVVHMAWPVRRRRRAQVTTNGWRGPGWRVFNGHPSHAKTVRDWIGRVIASHDCPIDPGDAELVVSEMFTNAFVHGPSCGRVLV